MHAHITPRTNVVRVGSFVYMYDTPLSGLNFSLNEHVQDSDNTLSFSSPFLLRLWFVACLRVMLTTNLMYPDPRITPYVAYMPGVQESLAAKFFGVPRRDTNCNRMDTTD